MQEPPRDKKSPRQRNDEPSEFVDALKKGAILGAALLVLLVPAMRHRQQLRSREAPPPPAPQSAPAVIDPRARVPQAAPVLRLADFGSEQPPADTRLVANWVVATANA